MHIYIYIYAYAYMYLYLNMMVVLLMKGWDSREGCGAGLDLTSDQIIPHCIVPCDYYECNKCDNYNEAMERGGGSGDTNLGPSLLLNGQIDTDTVIHYHYYRDN